MTVKVVLGCFGFCKNNNKPFWAELLKYVLLSVTELLFSFAQAYVKCALGEKETAPWILAGATFHIPVRAMALLSPATCLPVLPASANVRNIKLGS